MKPGRMVLLGLSAVFLAFAARGQPAFQGPGGSNYAGVDTTFGVTGDSVQIAIIEHPTSATQVGITDNHHLGSRLLGQWDFEGHEPPGWPPDQSTPPGCAPPDSMQASAGSSAHATLVANLAAGAPAGSSGVYSGVAPEALVFGGHIDSGTDFGAGTTTTRAAMDWIWNFAGAWAGVGGAPPIYNLSFGYPGNDDGENQLALFLDWWTAGGGLMMGPGRGSLVVVAAGNDSVVVRKPGDFFDGITVGAVDSTLTRRLGKSGHVLLPDVRGKPDLLAPGDQVSDGAIVSFGTSFAAPQVSGAAALLLEYGLFETQGDFARTAKGILLNSARKRFLGGENSENAVCKDHADTGDGEADYDYLDGGALRVGGTGAGPKTDDWTPAEWSRATASDPIVTTEPLDDEQGAGILDVKRALFQMGGPGLSGERTPADSLPSIGWSRSFVDTCCTVQTYTLKDSLQLGTFLTATVVWHREILETDPGIWNVPCSTQTGLGAVDSGDVYSPNPLPNLDLRILRWNEGAPETVAHSASLGNVEHVHVPVPETDLYQLRISLEPPDSTGTHFALAWWVQEPDGGAVVGVQVPPPAPRTRLHQSVPNPFSDATVIRFDLSREAPVALRVYDVRGRLVRTLTGGRQARGPHRVTWDGTDTDGRRVASGIYFYRLEGGRENLTRKVLLLR